MKLKRISPDGPMFGYKRGDVVRCEVLAFQPKGRVLLTMISNPGFSHFDYGKLTDDDVLPYSYRYGDSYFSFFLSCVFAGEPFMIRRFS
jgi:hypothetical protein